MKHQAKELSIRIEEERNTRWCRGLYYRLARLSHYFLYVFFLLMILFITYWLRIWPRYPPTSTNLSLTDTSARLNKVQISPYSKHGPFHRLRSHNARLGKHHRRHFNKKPVHRPQLSGDGEKTLEGYGVHRRNPWNKVREWEENSFHGRHTEDDDDQLQSPVKGHEMRGEGQGFMEEDLPRKRFPDGESDVMSEKGPEMDDVDREAEVRRSEGRLRVRKDQMKKLRRRGKKGKRPVISKKRILSEHARSRLYSFEDRKTEGSNNENGELNIATIDEEGKTNDIHEKNKYHGNSNIENVKPKKNIKKMNILEEMSDQHHIENSQISSTDNLNKYTNNIKKVIGRENGGKEVSGLKTSLGRNSWKYKANVRSSGLRKTSGSQKVAGDVEDTKGRLPKVKSLLNSKLNPGGRVTLQRMVGHSVNVHHTTQRSDRVQETVIQNMRLRDYLAKQRNKNRHLGKNLGILSTPNVSRKFQAGTLNGVRKDRGHKPGAIITILTRKVRYPLKTFVTTRSNIALLNNATNAILNHLKIHSKPIAPRLEKQHVVANAIFIPNKADISLSKPRIHLKLLSSVSVGGKD